MAIANRLARTVVWPDVIICQSRADVRCPADLRDDATQLGNDCGTGSPSEIERLAELHRRYRDGSVHVHVPEALADRRPLDGRSHRKITCPPRPPRWRPHARNLFSSLPVAFDPATFDWSVPRHRRSRFEGRAVSLSRHGGAHRHAGVRRERTRRHRGGAEPSAVHVLALRTLGVSDRRLAAAEGGAESHRAGGHASPLRREHRRRGGGERHQIGAPESREDVGRTGWRLRHLV